jgi:hypothetical protein
VRLPLTSTPSNIGVIDADGSFVATEAGEGEVKATYGGVTESVSIRVVNVDLKVYNGGSDLDNGEESGDEGSEVLNSDEENVGAYILVNWDDDDGDGNINNDGVWTREPIPDSEEVPSSPGDIITIEDEDTLAKLIPTIEPLPNAGTVEIEISSGVNKVKLWTASTKGRQITLIGGKKTWDFANSSEKADFQTVTKNGIWIEGIEASAAERDVTLVLRYKDSRGQEICTDTVKDTVVMLNLADGIYGWNTFFSGKWAFVSERGHTGVVVSYKGKCTANDLKNYINYRITEMHPDGIVSSRNVEDFMDELKNRTLPYWGTYTMEGISYKDRLKVIKSTNWLLNRDRRIRYVNVWDLLLPIGRLIEPLNWNRTLWTLEEEDLGLKALRCDGLIEVAYEINRIPVWGKLAWGVPDYDVTYSDAYFQEHNETSFEVSDWPRYIFPGTQCGYHAIYDGRTYGGVYWQTTFSQQRLKDPHW